MKKRFSTILIGLFVLGAAFLSVAGFLAFAGTGWWRDTQEFVVFFDESVHGLERGSAVRLKGVRVGTVSEILVRYDPQFGGWAQVVCELDRSRLTGPDGREIDLLDQRSLERLIEEGMGARLNLVGITGMLFVELDFFPERVGPERIDHREVSRPVVPAVPSVMTALVDNVAEVVRRLEEIDFAGIADSAGELIDQATEVLAEAEIVAFVAQLTETVESVNQLIQSGEVSDVLVSAESAFDELRRVSRRLDDQIDPVAESIVASSEEFQETLNEAAEAFASVRELAGPRFGLGPQAADAFTNIGEAARSIQRLADFLERNPQALLSGRRGDP